MTLYRYTIRDRSNPGSVLQSLWSDHSPEQVLKDRRIPGLGTLRRDHEIIKSEEKEIGILDSNIQN